jgi:hypothetical protein
MRSLKLATFAFLGIGCIAFQAPAQSVPTQSVPAQSPNGMTDTGAGGNYGLHEPFSKKASNIAAYDTRSNIAPALPTPRVGNDATPRDYVHAARDALAAGRTGETQQSLEMAETRALDRSVTPDAANVPDPNPTVTQIRNALQVLGEGDRGQALAMIDAMAH